MYTLQEILDLTVDFFSSKKIPHPRLEAEVLLADLLNVERIDLYVSFDQPLNQKEVDAFRERVRLRSQGCPTAYIMGKKEFLSREFILSREVLIPRPETEHLVEAVVERFQGQKGITLVDIATGSGVIAISLALALPTATFYASDLCSGALQVAWQNICRFDLQDRIQVHQGDLLTPFYGQQFDAIVSNPPYVSQEEYHTLPREIRDFEPRKALLAGVDGLDVIRPLISQGRCYLKEGGILALEVGSAQLQPVKDLLKENGYQLEGVIQDYAQIPRVILARKGEE